MDLLRLVPIAIRVKHCIAGHLFDYWSEMSGRDAQGKVHCRCARCGKMFTVDYGLQLSDFGVMAPLYQYGVMYA